MATEAQIVEGIRRADAAGDTASVKALGAELLRMRGQSTPKTAPKTAPKPAQRSTLSDLWAGTKNAAAGLAQGITAIPDAATEAMSGAMRYAGQAGSAVQGGLLDLVGAHDTADWVRGNAKKMDRAIATPTTLGGIVERAVPTPQDGAGQVARFGAQVLGGMAVPIPAGKSAIRAPVTKTPTEAQRAMSAADRQGITMLPADVGGTGTRMANGVATRTLGGIPIAAAAEKAVASAGNASQRVAANIGRVADDTGAGQAAQRGAKSFIKSSEERAGQLYEAISVPADAEAVATNTRAALAEVIQGFKSNPELSAIWTGHPRLRATLEALTPSNIVDEGRTALAKATKEFDAASSQYKILLNGVSAPADVVAARQGMETAQSAIAAAKQQMATDPGGRVSWQDMKRLRSIVGQIVGSPGLEADGATTAAMRKFYGALSSDMEATAAKAGPRALTEFNRATQYWRGRSERISNVLSGILGKNLDKGEASAFEQINRWAQKTGGDFKRLSQAIRSMPTEEADTVRASIIARMGKASPGRQNADGLLFSPAEWATQWNKLEPRAKSVLFPDGGHRADLNDLAVAMTGMKRAGQFSNFSNTSLGGNAAAHVTGLVTAPIFTIAALAAEFGGGKLLASPSFARWLAKMPKNVSASAVKGYSKRLTAIAAANPAIRTEIKSLQAAMNDNAVVSASAQDHEQQQPQEDALNP